MSLIAHNWAVYVISLRYIYLRETANILARSLIIVMGRAILRCIAVPNSHDKGIVGVTIRACGQSENGAERAENRVSGTGVVNGHSRKDSASGRSPIYR